MHPGAYGVLLPSSARCRCQCICLHSPACLLETSQNFMILTGSGLVLSICLSNIIILRPIIWRTCFRWKYSAVLHLSDKCRYVSIRELYVGRISSTSSHAWLSSSQKDILFKTFLRNIVSTSRWLWISIIFFLVILLCDDCNENILIQINVYFWRARYEIVYILIYNM